jgi:ribosome-associated protein
VLRINDKLSVPLDEIEFSAVRSRGPGGQNVNKVSTAIHLRFDVNASTALSDEAKRRVLAARDRRITGEGVIVIKSQRYRSQEKNRADALEKLAGLIRDALVEERPRRKTVPTKQSQKKRLEEKSRRGQLKRTRRRVIE